jgi:hypothetical protein
MSATKSPDNTRRNVPHGAAVSAEGAILLERPDASHNAGVAGSSPAPAIAAQRVSAKALISATTGATKHSEIGGPPSVYDARHGLMPLAFYCSRWAL